MHAFLSGAVRVFLATAMAVTAIALVLGRQYRPVPDARRAQMPDQQPISGYLFKTPLRGLTLMDVETGRLEPAATGGRVYIEHAAIAPWRDASGRAHAAGMRACRTGRGGQTTIGLGHFTLPEWGVLHEVETDLVPASPVCWFPDTTTRILFAGRDGQLYRVSFDDPAGEPQPLEWHVAPPRGTVFVSDPVWPTVSPPYNRIIVSLTYFPGVTAGGLPARSSRRSELWWLELDPEATAVKAAGRLISPAIPDTGAAIVEEEMPVIAACPDGGPTLAYLAFRRWEGSHRLRLAPLSIDAAGRMRADGVDVVELPGRRLRARPAFSKDGRWLRSVSAPAADTELVASIHVADYLAAIRARLTSSGPAFQASLGRVGPESTPPAGPRPRPGPRIHAAEGG